MNELLKNIRFYVLLFSTFLAGAIYLLSENINVLTQNYALSSVIFLYITLMASPVTRFFTFLPFRGLYLKARRALGVSAFLFALLHSYFAFFQTLGGFEGLKLLPANYLFGISIGVINLVILFLMAATASDYAVSYLSYPKWKILHRLIYLVAILVVIHAMIMGSHFADLSSSIPKIFFIAGGILLVLEIIRLLKYLRSKILYMI